MASQRKIVASDKKMFLVTGLAVTLLLGFGAWRQWVDAVPDVTVPTPEMPSPNAYDFYVKAGAAHVSPTTPVDPVHDSKSIPEAQWKTYYPTAGKEAWLRQNAKSLNLLRQGFQHECRMPPLRSSSIMRWPHSATIRELARKLAVESHARSERGNWSGAADSALDILRVGHDFSQGGVLVDYLVGSAINSIGRKELWTVLPHLNATEAKAKARRLEKIMQNRVSYADVMREEKYFGQAMLLEIMRSREWRDSEFTEATGMGRLNERWELFNTPKRVIFNNYTQYMDALIAITQKPYNADVTWPDIPADIYNRSFPTVFKNARWAYARDETANSLFLAALALHAYRLENSRAPKSLSELVPRYLRQVPADSFGDGPLRYRLTGGNAIVYSIGPDGVDNDGRPIEDGKIPKNQSRRFLVQPESKGDMVAGINR